jgi:hypothetical protein
MAWSYSDTISASWEANQIERREALAQIDSAHLREDWNDLQIASQRLRTADEEARWLSEKAQNLQRQQQAAQAQAPSNKFGLSRREQEVAEQSFVDRPDLPRLSTEQKHQLYAHNRARYHQMRANGTYDDTQGKVFRR